MAESITIDQKSSENASNAKKAESLITFETERGMWSNNLIEKLNVKEMEKMKINIKRVMWEWISEREKWARKSWRQKERVKNKKRGER